MPNSLIDKVEPGKIYNSGTPENVDLVVWTAGIQPVEVVRHLPIDINRSDVSSSINIIKCQHTLMYL